jgi:hypothetical protein
MTELSQRDQSLRVKSVEPTRKITGTHLSVSTVQMSLKFVLHAATSLRAAASVFQMVQGQCEADASHTTIRNLILRIGLYEISRPRPLANDWIWIVDHTIQAGTTKCFLVLGIRQVDYLALQRPLEHQDMDMLALIPVETSTGPIVHQQFTELAARCGVPLAILSDRGSDLKKGVELLQQDHPDVIGVYDVVHLVSGLTLSRTGAGVRRVEGRGRLGSACLFPARSFAGASIGSVRRLPSSNRVCGFPSLSVVENIRRRF